jgi:hypothetical protein
MISVSSGQTALESMGAVQGTVHLVARAVSAAGDEVRHEHVARPLPRTRTVVVSRGASPWPLRRRSSAPTSHFLRAPYHCGHPYADPRPPSIHSPQRLPTC